MLRSIAVACLLFAFPALAKKPEKQETKFKYTVQKGDTLECLDAKYHIQPGELAMLNGSPGAMTFKLVAGKSIFTPVQVARNACKGFSARSGEKGADHSLKDKACAVIDKTRKYTQREAAALLSALNSNPSCLKAAEILAQPSIEKLCEAIGHLMHSHHETHGLASSVEFLCVSAHLLAHQVHETAGHEGHEGKEHGASGKKH